MGLREGSLITLPAIAKHPAPSAFFPSVLEVVASPSQCFPKLCNHHYKNKTMFTKIDMKKGNEAMIRYLNKNTCTWLKIY